MTLSVEGIAITATEREVQRFFDEAIPGGDPIVKPLVSSAYRAFKSATVTFGGRTKAECKATFEKLKEHHRTLLDGTGTSSTLDYGEDFIGLTELANRCANDERPCFEYVLNSLACLPLCSKAPASILSMAWVVMHTTPSVTRQKITEEAICGLEILYLRA